MRRRLEPDYRRTEVRGGRSGGRESGIGPALRVTARPLPARAHSRAPGLPAAPPPLPYRAEALSERGPLPGPRAPTQVPGAPVPQAPEEPGAEPQAWSAWCGDGDGAIPGRVSRPELGGLA